MSNHNDKNRLNSGKILTDNAEDNPELSHKIYRIAGRNKEKKLQTSTPDKYPQGYFKDKKCKWCKTLFSPKAPSEMYCSDNCKDIGITNAYLVRIYNITIRDYTRMLEEQKGVCKICGKEGFTMAKHHVLKLVVDHCHTTNIVRGLLCHNCNRGLGLFKDDLETLNNAINYVKSATTIPNGSTPK